MSEENWIEVGSTDSIEEEDLIRFDHQDKTFCVYRLTDGFYATDGICCLLYTSPSPRDRSLSRMPSSA